MKAYCTNHQILVFTGTILFGLSGCMEAEPEKNAPQPGASKDEHAHEHPTERPHHGDLIELGKEEYHVELLHEKSVITIYVLDAAAKAPVAIEAKTIVINVKHEGKPEQFELAASPDSGDAEGTSSRFTIDNAELAEHLEHTDAEACLNVTINGTPYNASLAHSHEAHDHKHKPPIPASGIASAIRVTRTLCLLLTHPNAALQNTQQDIH